VKAAINRAKADLGPVDVLDRDTIQYLEKAKKNIASYIGDL
jgi:hypothetical protein